ncbi:MAG: (4Fe-4S)-binding protein [Bacteroidales bacterium]|nr:(4Fe-4S)-binding protein [Bacteroidales bacterium]
MKREFNNGIITIIWDKSKCIHSGKCLKGLPEVFKPNEKPWINMNKATILDLIHQVRKCPSGALTLKADQV